MSKDTRQKLVYNLLKNCEHLCSVCIQNYEMRVPLYARKVENHGMLCAGLFAQF